MSQSNVTDIVTVVDNFCRGSIGFSINHTSSISKRYFAIHYSVFYSTQTQPALIITRQKPQLSARCLAYVYSLRITQVCKYVSTSYLLVQKLSPEFLKS